MGNDTSKSSSIEELIKNDDFCSFGSLLAEDESLIKKSDDYGRTLLWGTCHYGRYGMVSLLLNHKPKLNQSGGESSTTPLMEAAKNGHSEIVQLLCDQGVVLDVIDLDGNTALLHAAKNKHVEILAFLCAKGSRADTINKERHGVSYFKCRGEFTRLIDTYLPMLGDESEKKRAILLAATKKDFAVCRGFIRAKISPNVFDENRKSIWFYTCLYNSTETAKLLKSVHANAQAHQDVSPSAEAIKNGNVKILEYLFECGANVCEIIGDNRNSLLHLAASYGHEDIINFLSSRNANIHSRNINNESVFDVSKWRTRPLVKELMGKTRKDETETVRRKLSKLGYEQNWRELTTLVTTLRRENRIKDSIQAPDGDGKTCLWWASFYGSLETTRFIVSLIKNFDHIKIIDSVGSKEFTTPLWIAAKQGYVEIVKLLHQYGANINAKDIYGNTPLHISTKHGQHKVMSYLVPAGIDYECKNNSGYTALDLTGWKYQTKSVLSSLLDAEIMRKEKMSNRRRSAEDTSTSLFVLRNSLERLQRSPDDTNEERLRARRNSELSNLRELIEDIEEDLNTEASLRELVNDLKYSGDEEIDKPIENLKHYLSNIIKENTNNNTNHELNSKPSETEDNKDLVFEDKEQETENDETFKPQNTSANGERDENPVLQEK